MNDSLITYDYSYRSSVIHEYQFTSSLYSRNIVYSAVNMPRNGHHLLPYDRHQHLIILHHHHPQAQHVPFTHVNPAEQPVELAQLLANKQASVYLHRNVPLRHSHTM
jgi:hypothetical protein